MNRKHLLVAGGFVAAILVTAFMNAQPGPGFPRGARWQYKVEQMETDRGSMQKTLDSLASEGWELVDVAAKVESESGNSPVRTEFFATFKRPEQPTRGGGRGGRGARPRDEAPKKTTEIDEETKKESSDK
jgi:hypothetical protein